MVSPNRTSWILPMLASTTSWLTFRPMPLSSWVNSFSPVDHHYPVPQSGGADIGSGGHVGRFRLGLDGLILLRCHPERDPLFFFLLHSHLSLPRLAKREPSGAGLVWKGRRSVVNLLSAFCRKQMIWNLRRRSGSGLPPGIRRFSGGAKTDKVGQALCLPSQMGGIRSRRGHRFPVAVIRREERMQGCKALRSLHPYSLAPAAANTTGCPVSLKRRPSFSWRSSACAPTHPAPSLGSALLRLAQVL